MYTFVRLCDLYKSVNQLRPPSSTTTEDDHLVNDPVAWADAKGGKKGDVLKLVSCLCNNVNSVSHVWHRFVGPGSSLYGTRPSHCQLSTCNSKTLP